MEQLVQVYDPATGLSAVVDVALKADAEGLPDTLVVSGTAGGVADGEYPRGLGANAYDSGATKWVKVGGAADQDFVLGGPDQGSVIFVGGGAYAYTDSVHGFPWQINPAQWLLSSDDSPNAATVGVAPQSLVLDPNSVVVGIDPSTGLGTDPGTAAAKGTFIEGPDTELSGNNRPVFFLVGGTEIDRINWNGSQYVTIVNDSYLYVTNNAPAHPKDGVWVLSDDGVNPVPTVTQGYSTQQTLDDDLSAASRATQKPYYRAIFGPSALNNFDHTIYATITSSGSDATVPDSGSFPIGWMLILKNSPTSTFNLIFAPTVNIDDGLTSLTLTPGQSATLVSRNAAGNWAHIS